jgi:ribosomal protein L37AE/L43A
MLIQQPKKVICARCKQPITGGRTVIDEMWHCSDCTYLHDHPDKEVPEPVEGTAKAPPVARTVLKAAMPEAIPTKTWPSPRNAHVPNPSKVEGLVVVTDMKIEPMGHAAAAEPAAAEIVRTFAAASVAKLMFVEADTRMVGVTEARTVEATVT